MWLDALEVYPCGLARIQWWSATGSVPGSLRFLCAGQEMQGLTARVRRPDIPDASAPYCGFVVEHLLPVDETPREFDLSLQVDGADLISLKATAALQPYHELLHTERVWSRHEIYTTAGTPPLMVSEEVVELLRFACAPILDFGCGSGVVLREMIRRKLDAVGVDLDCAWIRNALLPEVRDRVLLYPGGPLPFKNAQFGTVVATEVLDHIPDWRGAVAEIVRCASRSVIITVPNLDTIPLLASDYVIPWHLLEGDHRNFLTPKSLVAALKQHFRAVQLFLLHQKIVNGTTYFANVTVVASKSQWGNVTDI